MSVEILAAAFIAKVEAEKERGNQYVKSGQYKEACECYLACIQNLRICYSEEPGSSPALSPVLTARLSLEKKFVADAPPPSVPVSKAEMTMLTQKFLPAVLSNASLCSLKLEAVGDAIMFASEALKASHNQFAKAYFRRGMGYVQLRKFKQAANDFRCVCRVHPNDRDAAVRLKEAEKLWTQQRFAEAIASELPSRPSHSSTMMTWDIPKEYAGPVYKRGMYKKFSDNEENISPSKSDSAESDSAEVQKRALLQGFLDYFRENAEHRISNAVLRDIILDALEVQERLPNVVPVAVPEGTRLTVCGDVHGQFYDLLTILKEQGLPCAENKFLFNGDFVDRGSFSVEVITTLFLCKLLWPTHFFLNRGNHETREMTTMYGFEGELRAKQGAAHGAQLYELFLEAFEFLPLCHTIDNQVLVVHGGLSNLPDVPLAAIESIPRSKWPSALTPLSGHDDQMNKTLVDGEPIRAPWAYPISADTLMQDLLWADPQQAPGSMPSRRGVSNTFGPDITETFLRANKLRLVVRSHEMNQTGFESAHQGKLITVFSAPNYCDSMNNTAAFLVFTPESLKASDTTNMYEVKHFAESKQKPAGIQAMRYASRLVTGGM